MIELREGRDPYDGPRREPWDWLDLVLVAIILLLYALVPLGIVLSALTENLWWLLLCFVGMLPLLA